MNAMAASIIWSITGTHLPTNSSVAAEHQITMAGHDAIIFSTDEWKRKQDNDIWFYDIRYDGGYTQAEGVR